MTVDTAATIGRWPDILSALGVERRFLTAKNGPCPMCGGKDRWRFDDKDQRGTFFCNSCGSGDGFRLIELIHRCTFQEAGRMVESVIGAARIQPPRERIHEDEARAKANDIWRETVPMGEPLRRYLNSRRIGDRLWADIRFHAGLPWGASDERYPSMVAMARDAHGKPATLHRTYLADNGRKADVIAPRLLAGGLKLPESSAIRLCAIDGPKLGIGEGIETCMAASLMFEIPVWSAISEGAHGDMGATAGDRACRYSGRQRCQFRRAEGGIFAREEVGREEDRRHRRHPPPSRRGLGGCVDAGGEHAGAGRGGGCGMSAAIGPYAYRRGPAGLKRKRDDPENRYQCAVKRYLDYALPAPYDYYASPVGLNVGKIMGQMLKDRGVKPDWADITIVNLDTGGCRWLELKWDASLSDGQKIKAKRLGGKWATARRTLEAVEAALIGWGITPRCSIEHANRYTIAPEKIVPENDFHG